jgi:hypothetical protein
MPWWGVRGETHPVAKPGLAFDCPRCGATILPQWDKFQDAERAAWHPGPSKCVDELIEEAACRLLD